MAKDDLVTVSGQVEKVLGGGRYLVVLDNKHKITAQLSGRIEFLAMLRRPDERSSWELAALARPQYAHGAEPVLADFDGDGTTDLGVAHNNCGIPTYGGLSVYSAADRAFVEALDPPFSDS